MRTLSSRAVRWGTALLAQVFLAAVASGAKAANGTPPSAIEHTEDWDWIGFHSRTNDPAFNGFPAGDPRNAVVAADALADLGGCTGFLIERNLIASADHCFRSAAGTLPPVSRSVVFRSDTDAPLTWSCRGPVQSDETADVLTLRCDPNDDGQLPGDLIRPLRVATDPPGLDADLFTLSVNCRCDHWSLGCTRGAGPLGPWTSVVMGGTCSGSPAEGDGFYRLMAPGGLGQTSASRFRNCRVSNADTSWTTGSFYRGFNHNCDSLAGSSGEPTFARLSGRVIGVGSAAGHAGGTWNTAGELWRWARTVDIDGNGRVDAGEARRAHEWKRWGSEEDARRFCPANSAVTGFECRDANCDRVRIRCEPVPGGSGALRWTEFFSEEDAGFHGCGPGELMAGIDCDGSFCDNVSLGCRAANVALSGCSTTTPWISDEGVGGFVDVTGRFFQTARCRGGYCDDMQFRTCLPLSDSCQGHCGRVATDGSCWCDDACDRMGDCCSDVASLCR